MHCGRSVAPSVALALVCWCVHGILLVSGRTAQASADYTAMEDDTSVIHTALGDVVGVFEKSSDGKKFMAFRGIPYAKAPTGDLRFKEPTPVDQWKGIVAARSEGKMCYQPTTLSGKMKPGVSEYVKEIMKTMASLPNAARMAFRFVSNMGEDCLVLNVFTPLETLPADKLLPVLVFIHGGGFVFGSSDAFLYGPEYLMDKGVLLVTMNYRLGPLGFLSTNTSDAPGNAGLKDQRLALRWVRDNIRAFGGDPDQVTIYGESAGSYSVHLHVLSPGSKGLFRAAILSSSMAPNAYGFVNEPLDASRWLAEIMGADRDQSQDPTKLVEFLRTVSPKEMVKKVSAKFLNDMEHRSFVRALPFAAVVEPPDTQDAFLTRHPNDILRDGSFNQVPLMVGVNSEEGSLLYPIFHTILTPKSAMEMTAMWVPESMSSKLDGEHRQELGMKILRQYVRDRPLGNETLSALGALYGDEMLAHGIHVASRWHVKKSSPEAPVYLYLFDLHAFNMASFVLGVDDIVTGAGHADDIGYVFHAHLIDGMEVPNKDRVDKGRARMTELISNFVKEGKPTFTKTDVVDVEWLPATPTKEQFLEISDELVLRDGFPFADRMVFWDETAKQVLQDPLYDF